MEELVREQIPGFLEKIKTLRRLYPLIDELERKGLKCCERTTTFDCCETILLEQLESWKENGLPTEGG